MDNSSSSNNIPQKLRDLFTIEYCQNLVRRATEIAEIRVRCSELSRRDASCGYLGDYFKLAINCQIGGQHGDDAHTTYTFFVKTVPHDQPAILQMMHQLGIYGKENHLYHRIFPQIDRSSGKWRPHCYDAHNPDYLVLEDLTATWPGLNTERRRYQHLPHLRSFDAPHIRCVLHSLARMHAASLAEQLKDGGFDFAVHHLTESFVRPDCEWFRTGLHAIPAICRQLPNFAARFDTDARFRRHFLAALQQIFQPATGYCNVLCHRDLWFRNIMFEFETDGGGCPDFSRPVRSVLLDFQHSRLQPPAIDVAQLLHLGTRRAARDRHLDGHLRCYWHHLRQVMHRDYGEVSDRLPDLLTWSAFSDSFHALRPFALIFSCVYTPLMFLPARFLTQFRDNQRVERAEFVMDVMRRDAGYGEVVLESCAELVEHAERLMGAEQ